ncbi:MAG: DciA family protein [Actinomycetes bacterium]
MKRDLARELYRSFRGHPKKSPTSDSPENRQRVDDPQPLSLALTELVKSRDWRQGIAEGTLFTEWERVVGTEIATHAQPISLVDGRLTIQTTATAWATQLTLISSQLLATISSSAPGALVEEIVVIGPHAPSWKKGIRTIRGARGPRDTYS